MLFGSICLYSDVMPLCNCPACCVQAQDRTTLVSTGKLCLEYRYSKLLAVLCQLPNLQKTPHSLYSQLYQQQLHMCISPCKYKRAFGLQGQRLHHRHKYHQKVWYFRCQLLLQTAGLQALRQQGGSAQPVLCRYSMMQGTKECSLHKHQRLNAVAVVVLHSKHCSQSITRFSSKS